MAERERGRRLVPSRLRRNRTLVILVLVALVAIVIVVVALALGTTLGPGGGGDGADGDGYTPPPFVSSNQGADVKVDSLSVGDNGTTGSTTYLVTVTNTGEAPVSGNLSLQVYETAEVPAPNQPYPSIDPSTRDPTPRPTVTSTRQQVVLEPGETETVPVSVTAPPGYTINPNNVVVTLS